VLLKGGMVERKWGRIINIASVGGKIGIPFAAAYTASKHGVLGLTKALALELAKTGVTVNAICPGFVETDLAKDAMERHGKLMGVSAEEAWRQYSAKVPLGRWIASEEVASLAVYLASDAAAPVLGQAFNVCGGIGSY
jgi:ketoreductase